MRVTCYPMRNVKSCYKCGMKSKCDIYWLVMDLTAEREICPENINMEKCVITGRRIPGECEIK